MLAGLVAIGVATFSVTSNMQKQKTLLEGEKQRRLVEMQKAGSLNSVSRFKAIMSASKNADGDYIPALFATDYYQLDWKLMANPDIAMKDAVLSGNGKVLDIKVASDTGPTLEDLENIFAGSKSSQILTTDNAKLTILHVKNSDLNKYLVESIDVQVELDTKNNKSISRFRVPVPAPRPYDPILEISPANAENWSRDFSKKFPPGKYDLRVLASGVVLEAKLKQIDGNNEKVIATLGGFDLKGKIKHEAVQFLAKDKEIGRTTVSFADSGGKGDGDHCTYINYVGTYKFSAEVLGPDRKEKIELGQQTVQIQDGGTAPVDLPALAAACEKQCPYLGNLNNGDGFFDLLDPRLRAGNYIPVSSYGLMVVDRPLWNIGSLKVCVDYTIPSKLYESNHGGAYPPNMGELDNNLTEVIAFSPKDCNTRIPVFKRNSCGCFKDDTRILLGDQKTEKLISELNSDDRVWSPRRQKAYPVRHITRGPEKVPMLLIQAGGRSLQVTGQHPFPVAEGYKAAHSLKLGELIKLSDDQWAEIEGIESIASEGRDPIVWNLELEAPNDDLEAHEVVANGVVTGDLLIQVLLQSRDK